MAVHLHARTDREVVTERTEWAAWGCVTLCGEACDNVTTAYRNTVTAGDVTCPTCIRQAERFHIRH